MSYVRYRVVRALARKAIAGGAVREGVTALAWDISNGCLKPGYHSVAGGRSVARHIRLGDPEGDKPTFEVRMITKCRHCPVCLKHRGGEWANRVNQEMILSKMDGCRVWFVTFTFRPAIHLNALGSLQDDPRVWKGLVKSSSRLVTLWIKRIRKVAPIRYCLVCEPHKSGLPHYHAVLHETEKDNEISERLMRREWSVNGFLHAKLVNLEDSGGRDVAWYVSKYLSKEMRSRVRASRFYGKRSG